MPSGNVRNTSLMLNTHDHSSPGSNNTGSGSLASENWVRWSVLGAWLLISQTALTVVRRLPVLTAITTKEPSVGVANGRYRGPAETSRDGRDDCRCSHTDQVIVQTSATRDMTRAASATWTNYTPKSNRYMKVAFAWRVWCERASIRGAGMSHLVRRQGCQTCTDRPSMGVPG